MIEKRRLGNTDMVVTRVGFGGIPIMGVKKWRAAQIVNKALDLGINFIDTARAYDDGEEKIGQVMKSRRSECFLASKTHFFTESEAMAALETSLANLQTDYLDLWQLHDISTQDRWDVAFGPNGAMTALKKAQQQGKVRYLGVTSHNVPMSIDLVKTGEFSTILTCYNVMSPEPERELIPLAKKMGVGVIIMKPNVGGITFNLKEAAGETPEQREKSRLTIKDTMRFVLSNPDVDCLLAGPKLVREIVQDHKIASRYKPTTPEERSALIDYASKIFNPKFTVCLGCGYCNACPEKIPVSKYMLLIQDAYRLFYEWARHRKEYRSLSPDAGTCTECGKCEERCPQKINIRERLKQAKKRLDHPV